MFHLTQKMQNAIVELRHEWVLLLLNKLSASTTENVSIVLVEITYRTRLYCK